MIGARSMALTRKGQKWDLLRWILVLPVALGAYAGAQLVGLVMTMIVPYAWSELVSSILGPFCLVYAGAMTAPRQPVIVGVTLAVLYAVFYGAIVTLALVEQGWSAFAMWLGATWVVGLVAAIAACTAIYIRKTRSTRTRPAANVAGR